VVDDQGTELVRCPHRRQERPEEDAAVPVEEANGQREHPGPTTRETCNAPPIRMMPGGSRLSVPVDEQQAGAQQPRQGGGPRGGAGSSAEDPREEEWTSDAEGVEHAEDPRIAIGRRVAAPRGDEEQEEPQAEGEEQGI
jgi:hypothetical protein